MYYDPTLGRRVPFATLEEREAAFQVRRKEYDAYVNGLKHKGLHGLSGEIDRCLKKVSEGVETFEDIWQKVHNATNTNQKEKYETDLKKEIKKLQRLRDQIKSWIASGEIKDKSTLVDTRKLIETQMERFKVVERETKTKAYSKEGLGAAQKLDPMTRERDELTNWLAASIDSVQVQMDQFESEIELIMAAKKKRLDKEKQDRLDELKVFLEKHKFHMGKLETLMRMLDNLAADPNAVSSMSVSDDLPRVELRNFLNQVRKIKDDMEYYLESSQEPEFEENEFMYDDIDGLEEQQALGNSIGAGGDAEFTGTPTSTTSGNTSPVSPIHSSDSSSDPEKRRKSSDDSSKVVRPVAMKPNHMSTPPPSGTKAVSTPPIHAGTPNNSSPSSGLMSNHVSSFSSLSSSPTQTHNYHNALNNVKSLPQIDGSEQNETDSNATISESATAILMSSGSANGGLSHSLLSNSSEPFEFQSTPTAGSTLTSVPVTNSPATSTPVTSNGLRNSFGAEELESLSSSPTHQDSKSQHHLYHPVGLHSSKEEQESLENGTADNHTASHPALAPLSLVAMSMTALANLGGPNGGNHLNLPAGGPNDSGSTNGPLPHSTANSLQPSISALNISSNSTSLSSQQLQATALTPAHTQQSKGQPGSSREITSPTTAMDFLRMAPEQMLLDRYLSTSSDSDRIEAMASLKTMAQDAMDRAGIHASDPNALQRTTTEAHIPPLLGVAPLGPVPLGREHQTQFQMLESAHFHMPVPADSERMRQFLPRNPIPTPGYYPQAPLLNSDSLDFFGRLSIETLFFIFYYLEGTKAQYLAAKVLKKQSWRFHTKYMMWFQRHEEPKVINEEYEQGTYIYFDIEKWGQRKKDGFVFEYRYLEDRDLS